MNRKDYVPLLVQLMAMLTSLFKRDPEARRRREEWKQRKREAREARRQERRERKAARRAERAARKAARRK